MDIKIQCACGQKIAFDVEPENHAMPCPLSCPACASDVTALANDAIRQQSPPLAATAPEAPATRIRISLSTAHPPTPPPATEAPAQAPASPSPATTPAGRSRATAAAVPPPTPARGADDGATAGVFLLGTVGVLGGTVAGLIVWFLLAKVGLTLKILAVLVGAGAGLGARVFCRQGDNALGGVAAVVAVLGMFVGGPLILDQRLRITDKEMRELYDETVTEAKQIVAAVPKGTDEEIAKYLGSQPENSGPATPEDIREFRGSHEYRWAKDLASGKRTYATHAAWMRQNEDELHKKLSGAIAGVGAVSMLRIWLIALVGGTAYKLAAG